MSTVYLLTGDIGGTNSRMSLYKLGEDKACVMKTYRNATEIPEDKLGEQTVFLDYVIRPFTEYCWKEQTEAKLISPSKGITIVCCIACAGVVANNQVRMTNLKNMLIDGNLIQSDASTPIMKSVVRCMVINDFVAQGYGCLTLKPTEVEHLYGPKDETVFDDGCSFTLGPKVCVGAGTGLGECYLAQSVHAEDGDENPYSCFPSEGGHVEFAPRNQLEVELFEYLSQKFASKSRISVERVVSGKGLANVYEFLAHKFPERIDKAVHEEFLAAGDQQGRVVAVTATKDESGRSLCRHAMSITISAYGCEVGSAAIKWIPTGGLFVTGGLTPKNIHFIKGPHSDFMLSYVNKGRVSPLLERIPLYAVMTEDLGVRGAHKAALMAYEAYSQSPTKPQKKKPQTAEEKAATAAMWSLVGTTVAAAIGSTLAMILMNARK